MNKKLVAFLSIMILGASTVFGQVGESYINDGVTTYMVSSIVKENTTYLGVRDLGWAVGMGVEYIAETQTAILNSANHTMRIELKNGKAFLDDVAIGVAPVILEKGSTYLPFRWICERFEFEVGFEDGVILIDTKGNSLPVMSLSEDETSSTVPVTDTSTTSNEVKDSKNFSPKEYYIDYLVNLRDMSGCVIDSTREGFYEESVPTFETIKNHIDEVRAKLKGTEYEALVSKYDGLAGQIVKLYTTQGVGLEKIDRQIADCLETANQELQRLNVSHEEALTVYSLYEKLYR